ncbi:hypothetical protein E0H26_13880 [Micromonospora zingiberis]|uniref:ABC transporter substrate-binding protein n=1 Tax=Micromonospora zingiberis TaxID=2053011 RepID=A0A4R0GMR2_9ACTN|nr:hypothetical protein [Micromonospora zingiberis]TCB96718.1 hypothetical protein E0H26_13880 [Micromonospora zingiberis]
MKLRRTVRAAAGAAALTLLATLAACGSADGRGTSTAGDSRSQTLKIGTADVTLGAGWAAQGILKDLAYNVEFVRFQNQLEVTAALQSGEIDGSFAALFTPVQAAAGAPTPWTAETAPFKVILASSPADLGEGYPYGTSAAPKSGITELTASTVRGKRWTAVPGAGNYLTLLATLKHLGLTLDDIEYVPLSPTDGPVAFAQSSVDLHSGLYSSINAGLQAGGRKLLNANTIGATTQAGLIASTASLNDSAKSKLWEDFVVRWVQHFHWKVTHPDEVQADLVATVKYDAERARLSWLGLGRNTAEPISEKYLTTTQTVAALALEGKAIDRAVDDVSILFDDRFNTLIEAEAKRLGYDEAIRNSVATHSE